MSPRDLTRKARSSVGHRDLKVPAPRREPSRYLLGLAAEWLRVLRRAPAEGLTRAEIERQVDADDEGDKWQSLRRARSLLADEYGIEIPVDGSNRYRLADPEASLPLIDPTPEDVAAVVMATSLLRPIVDQGLARHLERLVADIDAAYLARNPGRRGTRVRPRSVSSSFSTGQPSNPKVLGALALACGRHPVRLRYYSPWRDDTRVYTVEPWQIRVHDGAFYLRAWSRTARAVRLFRVAQIESCAVIDHEAPRERSPAASAAADAPAYGLDEDRPDTAVIQVAGPYARWIALERWHPDQQDRWLDGERERFERRLPYRSCRELARRLLTLGDALRSVKPEALALEVRTHAEALSRSLALR